MRFQPNYRTAFVDTPRKRMAATRRQLREQQALPLFADAIAQQQPSIDQVMAERADRWVRHEQSMRDFEARVWRSARRRFYAVPAAARHQLRQYWNNHRWFPGRATSFAGFMDLYERGGLNIECS